MIFISDKKMICPRCFYEQELDSSSCSNCGHDFSDKSGLIINPPKVSRLLRFKREKTFYSNYDYNLIECPKCGSKLLYDDVFCYKCGCEVSDVEETLPAAEKIKVSKFLRFTRKTRFLAGYDFNIKKCPECDSGLLLNSKYCYKCGVKVKSDGENRNVFKPFNSNF